jgi:hypothetical protein
VRFEVNEDRRLVELLMRLIERTVAITQGLQNLGHVIPEYSVPPARRTEGQPARAHMAYQVQSHLPWFFFSPLAKDFIAHQKGLKV